MYILNKTVGYDSPSSLGMISGLSSESERLTLTAIGDFLLLLSLLLLLRRLCLILIIDMVAILNRTQLITIINAIIITGKILYSSSVPEITATVRAEKT